MTATQITAVAPADRARYRIGILAVLALICLAGALRGERDTLEPVSFIYYVVDYSNGLIRRGLIGQIFMLFYSRAQAMQAWRMAVTIHQILATGIILGILAWLSSVLWTNRRFGPARLGAAFAIFAASQFYPTMLALTTYVDCYILALTLCGFVLASRGHYLAASVAGFAGPFIHEMSVLLWFPLGLMMIWRDGLWGLRRPAVLFMCISPLIGGAVLAHFESLTALAVQLARAPISPELRDLMAREQMGHTIIGDLGVMSRLYAAYPWRAWISIVAFFMPTLAMLAIAAPALSRRGALLLILAASSPLAVLALEFDLSRFVTMSQFVAMLCILFIAQTPARGDASIPLSKAGLYASVACAVLLLSLPLFYGYFDHTLIAGTGLLGALPVLGPVLQALYHGIGTVLT